MRARPQRPVPNCREAGAIAGFMTVILPFVRPVSKHRALYFSGYFVKVQTLPPIEFFMGMLAGGILGYLVAIMVNSGNEAGHR
jgi:hypothetical protein